MTGPGPAGQVPAPPVTPAVYSHDLRSAGYPLVGRPALVTDMTADAVPQRPDAAPPGRSRPGTASPVSAEELEILRHIADGLPINSVAQRVGTSPRTVRRRMRHLCDRIGATCAIQAVVWAAHRGLV